MDKEGTCLKDMYVPSRNSWGGGVFWAGILQGGLGLTPKKLGGGGGGGVNPLTSLDPPLFGIQSSGSKYC